MDEIDQDLQHASKLMADHDHGSSAQKAVETTAQTIVATQAPAGPVPTALVTPGECVVRSFKLNIVLRAEDVLAIPTQDGQDRATVMLRQNGGRTLTVNLAAKSVRKAAAAIRSSPAGTIVPVIQGKLGPAGATIEDAGLVAQPRAAKKASDGGRR
jgi:hypothetical protein